MSILSSLSFSADSIKMRWKEPYVTAGLNQKTLAVLPRGIFAGFNPVSTGVGWGLTLNIDAALGISGANVLETTLNKFSVTLIQVTNIALDLTAQAGTTVFIALDAQYAIGSSTTAQVVVVDLAELALNPDLILVAKVNVPGVSPILSTHINTGYRAHAGDALTVESRPAFSLLSNGNFERDVTGTNPVGWVQTGGLTLTADAVVFRSGAKSMKLVSPSAVVRSAISNPSPVIPGYKYKAVIWMRSDAGNPIAGGTGVHAQVQFFDLNGTLLTTTDVETPFTGGAVLFEVRSLEVTAPANAANAKFKILFDSCSGWLYVDDVELSNRKTDTLPGGAGVDERFVLYGAPLGVINAFRIDGTNANGAVAGTPFQFTADDTSTVPMVVKQFTGSTQDIVQWQSSAGLPLLRVSSDGKLRFGATADWSLFRNTANDVVLTNLDTFAQTRNFKFSAFTIPVGSDGNTNFELLGMTPGDLPAVQFKISLGNFSFAGMRLGSENNIGLRIRINATDGWLFANNGTGPFPYDLFAATGAGIVGLRAPGAGDPISGESFYTEAARLGTIQVVSKPNLLVNGDMAIWQRFYATGPLAGTITSGPGRQVLADRWYVHSNAPASTTPWSRTDLQTSPVYPFKHGIRFGRAPGNTSILIRGLRQEIDREVWRQNVGQFGNANLVLSFWVRCGANFSGTSMDPVMLYNAFALGEVANHTNSFNGSWGGAVNIFITPFVSIVPTTSWVKYNVAFGNIGGTAAALDFRYFPTGTAGADDWVEITGVCLRTSNGNGTDLNGLGFVLSSGTPEGELVACQKYYEKSYNTELQPSDTSNHGGSQRIRFGSIPFNNWSPNVHFRTTKMPYASNGVSFPYGPTIFNPVTGTASKVAGIDGIGNYNVDSPSAIYCGQNGFHIEVDDTPVADTVAIAHWTVDVEM